MQILFLIWLVFFSAGKARASALVLEVGASDFVLAPSSGPVRVKNSKIISVVDLGRKIKVIGRKAGSATITTNIDTTDVYILSHDDFEFYKSAKEEISEMRGLQINVDDKGIFVSGKLLRASDWEILSNLSSHPRYRFMAEIDSNIEASARELIEAKIKAANLSLPVIRISPTPALFIAKEQTTQKDLYQSAVSNLGLSVEETDAVVDLQPLVRVRIAVTEIRKSFLQKFGVTWPSSFEAQVLPKFVAPSGGEGVNLQLDALESNGFGKILASPNILCRSGKTAEFFAGGEFPIKLISHRNHEVIWKRHGIILKVSPLADASGRMSIALTTEVSTIDQSQTVDGVPGLLTNRIESHFDLSSSRTIALSGLLKEESGNDRAGLPGLGSIPILGSLFSSQDYRDHKTELIVFVTPEVVKENGSGAPL